MIKKNHGNLMCQLALLRASEGSFPEADFKPLWTNAALEASNDTIRMNLARVLVTKVLNEGKRLTLITKIAEPNGKLLRSTIRELIQSQGVLTPSLDKYLKVSLSSSHIRAWQKIKRGYKRVLELDYNYHTSNTNDIADVVVTSAIIITTTTT